MLEKVNFLKKVHNGPPLALALARGEVCRERSYLEGVIYLVKCRGCKGQAAGGVVENDVTEEVYMGESHRFIVIRSHLSRTPTLSRSIQS